MIGGPRGILDHPPTKSVFMLPLSALINVTQITMGFHLLSQSQDARESTWAVGEQSYTESLDTVTDISSRVINPRKKRDAKTFILKDIHPQTIRTLKCLSEQIF